MKRWRIVAALCSLSLLLYIDRVCISSAKKQIALELGLSNANMGWVFGVFTIGYALAQIPSGYLADRIGPRRLITVAVTAWSVLTAATGMMFGLTPLLGVRFLFGIGEAGAFPGAARVFFAWLAPGERGLANGLLFSGSRIGGGLAYLVLPGLIEGWGWRAMFLVLGGTGLVWAAIWYWRFRDAPQPEDLPSSARDSAAEPTSPVKGDEPALGKALRSRELGLVMLQYFASNFTFFIGLSWMLPYLQDRFHLTAVVAGRYAMIPLLFAATSQWASGYLVDRLYRSRFAAWSRRLPALLGFSLAAVAIASVAEVDTVGAVVACFTLAVFGTDMTISPSWTYCVDLGGRGSGTISGAMNMAGNVGSFVSSIAFPFLIGVTGSASTYFFVAATLNVAGALVWLGLGPRRAATTLVEAVT